MISCMLNFPLLRNSSDLHIFKDLYGETLEKKNYYSITIKNPRRFLCVVYGFLTDLERLSVV